MSIHYDDKYLLKKADEKVKNLTIFFFAVGIKEIYIPSNIKSISSDTLYQCMNLKKVEIPQNSNLQTTESYSFSNSKIKKKKKTSKVSKI